VERNRGNLYLNQLADTPFDAPFQKFLWESDSREIELRAG
jgi:hypothetical protein